MAEISIIVPVYNEKLHLSRCVNSILKQTYTDYEVILVDDGSSDGSEKICDEYALFDRRFIVIHQENCGPAVARNTALEWIFEHSKSQWITFIDSDDYIHPEYLRMLLLANVKNETRISCTGFKLVYRDMMIPHSVTDLFTKVETANGYIDNSGWVNAYAWGKLLSKELFRDIRFPKDKIWEDLATMYKVLLQQKHMSIVEDKLYYYYQNPKSITHLEWSVKKLDEVEAYENQLAFFEKMNVNLYVAVLNSYSKALYGQIRSINMTKNRKFKRYRAILSKK